MTQEEQAWQDILNRAAFFNMLGLPDPSKVNTPVPMPGRTNELAGIVFNGLGHRFDIVTERSADGQLRATNTVGEQTSAFTFRFLPIPDDYAVFPDQEPPATQLEPSRAQRFAMLDGEITLGPGNTNKLSMFGSGRTIPNNIPGERSLRIAGIGIVTGGSDQVNGLDGVLLVTGTITPPLEFELHVVVRMPDPSGSLLSVEPLPPIQPIANPLGATTYLDVRTEALPDTTVAGPAPDGKSVKLTTDERMTLRHVDFSTGASQGLLSKSEIGPAIGFHTVDLSLFPSPGNLGMTPESPTPFFDREQFLFENASGKVVSTLQADVIEGRSFVVQVAGIPDKLAPQINAGFTLVSGGSGQFAGAEGIVANVAIGTLGPHLTDILYFMALSDPTGKYRTGGA